MKFLDFAFGTITGLISSFLIWLAFSRIVHPKLELSTHISKIPSLVKNTPLYKIKIENLSLCPVYDIQITGRIKIYGLIASNPDKPVGFVALIGSGKHPYIESKLQNKSIDITGRELLVRPTDKAKRDLSALWSTTKNAINIEYILSRDTRNLLEVSAIGTHGFSGARRLFTMQYHYERITPIYFASKGIDVCCNERQDNTLEEDEETVQGDDK